MPRAWVVALFLTLATYSNVSAVPRSGRVSPATPPETPPPIATPPPRAEVERIAALLVRDHSPEPAIEIAARWTREAPNGQATIVGDRVVWVDTNMFSAVSLRDGAIVAARWERQWPEAQRVARIADAGGGLLVSLFSGTSAPSAEVLALGRDGTTRWRTPLPSRMVELRTDGEALFAFESDPTVWRLDPRTGRVLWSHASDQPIVDVVAISTGINAIVRPEDILLVDDAGRDLLTRPRNPHVLTFNVRDSRLFSCKDDGTLHAIDIRDGRDLWWAQVSTAGERCAVLGATGESVLVEGAGRLLALDTTQAAPRAPAVTISGRFEDVRSNRPRVRGILVRVGNRRVRTDARGRFVATVRVHGPIEVYLFDASGARRSTIVWPDAQARNYVELSNYESDSCH